MSMEQFINALIDRLDDDDDDDYVYDDDEEEQRMKYLIEMIERRRFYIEADTEEEALDWAATHTAFDVQNEIQNESYFVDYEERCIGQTDENVDAIKIN